MSMDQIESTMGNISKACFEDKGAKDVIEMDGMENIDDRISENTLVYLIGSPESRGIVMSVSDVEGIREYTVFVDGALKTFYSGQIAPYVEEPSYKWVNARRFMSYLTAYQINNPSCSNLYSLNSARIDFVPYQFRPALKLINSDEPRILIADGVGVGKTIETGLIIKELQARGELENILIICPKPLVVERKWELEMKRFDEEFIPLDGNQLRQILSDTDRDGEWPIRYNKVIVPYSILDSRTYEGVQKKRKRSFGLMELDPAPHFDLVIVDEAHHIRNGSMEKEKAFEYKCVKFFCDHADAVVMLTATPLQTSDEDLFTLMNVLRPDAVIDQDTFHLMSQPNAYISRCSKILREGGSDWKQLAWGELQGILETRWGKNVITENPAYARAVSILQQSEITKDERVELISEVESLHSFNNMMNRTRRKDIQDFCVRRPYTLRVGFTDTQKELHDELLQFEEQALAMIHGDARPMSFMMSMIKRQAASCIFGLAPHVRDLTKRRFLQMEEDPDIDYAGFSIEESEAAELEHLSEKLLWMADNLPEEDPKFDQMMKVIREKQEQDNNKIIIFSTFRFTLEYLYNKLSAAGMRVEQITGSVGDDVRREFRERFRLPKGDRNAVDILLFTEVGSEGLDYQFCNMMINYDLPWNPMKIEQRIGRIDRCGQQSESISIYNIITEGTVDADIYDRCLVRIGIFEDSIGESEEILGEIATQIESIALDANLNEEERRIKLEQMADNEIRRLQEITALEDEEKELFGFDLSEYTTSQDISNADNPWLRPESIQLMVGEYLSDRFGKTRCIMGKGDVKKLRLSREVRSALRDDLISLPGGRNFVRQRWNAYLKGTQPIHDITFAAEGAEKNRDAFFITAMHPLAKQAARYFKSGERSYIHLQHCETGHMAAGRYCFSIYAWDYRGLNPRFRIKVVCKDDLIADGLQDILREATSCDSLEKILSSEQEYLKRKHIELWKKARKQAVEEANRDSAFRIESLTNNYNYRKRSLEQKIESTENENICKMYHGELETATRNYEVKLKSIQDKTRQTDIHITLIAMGVLEVVSDKHKKS